MKLTLTPLALLAALGLGACSSLGYGDPNAVETVNIGYGSTDLQTISGEMVDSLIASPALSYLDRPNKGDDLRIRTVFGGINNRTSEHIDTTGIADKIRVQMLKTGKFRWMAGDQGQDEIGEQIRFQQGSGRVDTEQAMAFGKQLGAEIVLYGNMRSIDKRKDSSIETGGTSTRDVYYQFVLNAVNVETGEIIWAEEAELRKTEKTGLFGR